MFVCFFFLVKVEIRVSFASSCTRSLFLNKLLTNTNRPFSLIYINQETFAFTLLGHFFQEKYVSEQLMLFSLPLPLLINLSLTYHYFITILSFLCQVTPVLGARPSTKFYYESLLCCITNAHLTHGCKAINNNNNNNNNNNKPSYFY